MTIYTTAEAFEDLTPSPQQQLGSSLGAGLSSGLQMLVQQKVEDLKKGAQKRDLISKGFPPEIAEVWGELTEGGRTKFAELFMDQLQRNLPLQDEREIEEQKMEGGSRDVGLTPRESVSRQDKRYDKNLPLYQKHEEKSRGLETENLKINQLQRLNQADGLPKGLGRLNVNFKTGELLIPAAASPEAQLFVKTLNDFLIGAKETYGARVTNFEVNRFLKRLPTLANSKEGREVILRQMEIINELNQLRDGGILNAFEGAGGLRNIDYDKAVSQGRKLTQEREKQLKSEFSGLTKRKISPTSAQGIKETEVIMIDPLGRRRAVDKKDVKSAKNAGYKLSR